ncbi:hypothetical protein BDW75DRAFT_201738 [Aspergillus navahoensis]
MAHTSNSNSEATIGRLAPNRPYNTAIYHFNGQDCPSMDTGALKINVWVLLRSAQQRQGKHDRRLATNASACLVHLAAGVLSAFRSMASKITK